MENNLLKINLRREIKSRLKDMTAEQRRQESESVWQQVCQHPAFRRADTVLLYWSMPNEVDTHQFVKDWSERKNILLPVVVGDHLKLKPFEGMHKMKEGAYGILEPTTKTWTDYDGIDLCIIPGVAFDNAGHRMGHGKGYYDRLLEIVQAVKLGVCFSTQLVDEIPTEPWDEEMDQVIAGKR